MFVLEILEIVRRITTDGTFRQLRGVKNLAKLCEHAIRIADCVAIGRDSQKCFLGVLSGAVALKHSKIRFLEMPFLGNFFILGKFCERARLDSQETQKTGF